MPDVLISVLSCLDGTFHICLHGLHRLRDLLREFTGLFGELSDLFGNNGKSASVLTCASRLNRSV